MAFGLNRAEVIRRLGADVSVNHLTSGGKVANLSIATDESYIDKQSGERVDRTEWHRVVTFQPGLVDMFERHARKGPAGLCRGQAADPALEERRRGQRSVLDRDPAGARWAGAVFGQGDERAGQSGDAGRWYCQVNRFEDVIRSERRFQVIDYWLQGRLILPQIRQDLG